MTNTPDTNQGALAHAESLTASSKQVDNHNEAQSQFWALTEVSQLSPNTKAQLVALLLSERADELKALPVTTPQVGVPYVTEAYIASRYLELKRELEKQREVTE